MASWLTFVPCRSCVLACKKVPTIDFPADVAVLTLPSQLVQQWRESPGQLGWQGFEQLAIDQPDLDQVAQMDPILISIGH
jgi:hypothetical protein